MERVGIIGYGEVGRIVAQGLRERGVLQVVVWDIALADPVRAPAMRAAAQAAGVQPCASAAELCAARPALIVSAVTASNTLAVASEVAPHLAAGSFFLDLNSASPGTKQAAAALVDGAGGRYVEAGVMTSVPPHGLRVPMLIGGASAQALLPTLLGWGMDVRVASERLGVASATKMCRSVMIKGLEALVIESYTAARAYGVEDAMVATLQETFPGIDWTQQARYFFSRVAQHGQRRAEEMREVARTVQEAGFEPLLSQAIAAKHDAVAADARAGAFGDVAAGALPTWQAYADALIARTKP